MTPALISPEAFPSKFITHYKYKLIDWFYSCQQAKQTAYFPSISVANSSDTVYFAVNSLGCLNIEANLQVFPFFGGNVAVTWNDRLFGGCNHSLAVK